MNRKTILALAIATVIVMATADPAMAYVLLSPRRTWASTFSNRWSRTHAPAAAPKSASASNEEKKP